MKLIKELKRLKNEKSKEKKLIAKAIKRLERKKTKHMKVKAKVDGPINAIHPTGMVFNGRCMPIRFGKGLLYTYFTRTNDHLFIARNDVDSIMLDVYNTHTGEMTITKLTGLNHVDAMQYLNGHLYILHNEIGYDYIKHYTTKASEPIRIDTTVFITSYCVETRVVEVIVPNKSDEFAGVVICGSDLYVCGDRLIVVDNDDPGRPIIISYDPETNFITGLLDDIENRAYDACGDSFITVILDGIIGIFNQNLQHIKNIKLIHNCVDGLLHFRSGILHHEIWNQGQYAGSMYKYIDETFVPIEQPQKIKQLTESFTVVSSNMSDSKIFIYSIARDRHIREPNHDSVAYAGGSLIHIPRGKKTYGDYSVIFADNNALMVSRRLYLMNEWDKSAYASAYVGMGRVQLRMFRWTTAFLYWVFHYQLNITSDLTHYIMRFIAI